MNKKKKNQIKKSIIILSTLILASCDQTPPPQPVVQQPIVIPPQPATNIETTNQTNVRQIGNTISLDSLANSNSSGGGITKLLNSNSNSVKAQNMISQPERFLITNDPVGTLNAIRSKMGIPLLQRNSALDTAARYHAQYILLNNDVSHDENPGRPYFYAKTPLERVQKTNYNEGQTFTTGEVLSYTEGNPNESFDKLMRAIYHRFVMLDPVYTEVGMSQMQQNKASVLEMALASRGETYKKAPLKVSIYPLDKQTGIPYVFYTNEEVPNPMPGYERVGFPISIQTTAGYPLETKTFVLIEKNTGSEVAGKYLIYGQDEHVLNSQLALVPFNPLKPGTTYVVTYVGYTKGVALNYKWEFTTADVPKMMATVNQQYFKPGEEVIVSYSAQESKKVKSSTTISGTDTNLLQMEKEDWGRITYKALNGCLDPNGCNATITFKNEDGQQQAVSFMIMP